MLLICYFSSILWTSLINDNQPGEHLRLQIFTAYCCSSCQQLICFAVIRLSTQLEQVGPQVHMKRRIHSTCRSYWNTCMCTVIVTSSFLLSTPIRCLFKCISSFCITLYIPILLLLHYVSKQFSCSIQLLWFPAVNISLPENCKIATDHCKSVTFRHLLYQCKSVFGLILCLDNRKSHTFWLY